MAQGRGYWMWLVFMISVSYVLAADQCPSKDIIKCNRDLGAQLDTFNALPRSANAQKCSLLFAIQDIASTCMDLDLAGCDQNTLEVTENWEALKSIPEVEDCKEIMCESDELEPEVLDGCIETLEDDFRDIDSLCTSFDGEAVIANSRSCVSDALSMCSADIQQFWQQQIDTFAAEMTSVITIATCEAYETCTDVPAMLDAIQECHNDNSLPMNAVPLTQLCREASALIACLTTATYGCDPLRELYIGTDNIMMQRLITVGCLRLQEEGECNYKIWSDCYSPIASSVGPAYYNYQTDVLQMFRVEDMDWAELCSALQNANVDEMERCASQQATYCIVNTGLNGLDTSSTATSGKFQSDLLLNTLNPDVLAFVKSGYCNSGGCNRIEENLASLAQCTSGTDLNMVARRVVVAGESCSELRDIMSCSMGLVSTCRLLQQSLYQQLDAVPMMSQALGLCNITPQLATMECLHENYRMEMIHTECQNLPTTYQCEYIEKYAGCILKWSSGCDYVKHTYLDRYLLDMALISDASGCLLKLDHQVITKDCYHAPCYFGVLQSLTSVNPWASLPIESVQAMQLLTQGDIQCNNLGLLTNAATCNADTTDEDQCLVSRAAITYSSTSFLVYNVNAMIDATTILCARESTCRNGEATMLALSLCLEPMQHVHLLASRVLNKQQMGKDTTKTCSDLSEWASCYLSAAASCSLIDNAILTSVMDDRDWEAVRVCDINLDLVYPTTIEPTTAETTTVAERTTTVAERTTTVAERTTTVAEGTSAVPITTTAVFDEETTTSSFTTITESPEPTTSEYGKPAVTSMEPDNGTPETETTPVPTKKPEVNAAAAMTPWKTHTLAISILLVLLGYMF